MKKIQPLSLKLFFSSLSLGLILAAGPVQAQNEFYIQAGGSVTVSGYDGVNPTLFVGGQTVLAGAGATLNNSAGYVQVTGDISNSGTLTSTGTDKFSGSGNQTLSGTFSGSSYLGDVLKANIGNIVLSNNADVNSLTFSSDGKVDASSGTTLYIKSATYTSISGQSSLRYVDVGTTGGLKRAMSDIVSGHYYAFPMGNSTAGYKRMDVNLVSLGSTGAGTATGMLKNGSPGSIAFNKYYSTGFSGSSGGPCAAGTRPQWVEFTAMSSNYWSFSGPTDWTQNMLAYTGTAPSVKERRLLQSAAGSGAWTAGVESSIVGTVTTSLCANTDWSNGASSTVPGGTYRSMAADFGVGAGSNTALPVTLLYLTASPVNNTYIKLDWATASEINNKGFEIERSLDGSGFENIGWMDGHGTSNSTILYTQDDKAVQPNVIYYYRLKQIDLDGHFEYSEIVSASLVGDKGFMVEELRPNPASGSVQLAVLTATSQKTAVTVTNMLGQIVMDTPWQLSEGYNVNTLDISGLAQGTYSVTLQSGNQYFTKKLVITR
jgi:hypothetical protein